MWQKVTGKSFGIVVCNFKSDIPESLTLTVGQRVHIKQKNEDWYYGYASTNPSNLGVFPATHIHIVPPPPAEGSQEFNQPHLGTPILEEVVVVLKEWAEIIRELYTNPNYLCRKPPDMRGVFKKLADLRRDILSNQLTIQHQKDAKHSLVQLIAEGNKNLTKYFDNVKRDSADLVRHLTIGLIPTVDGDVVDIDSVSIVALHKIHTDCNQELVSSESKPSRRSWDEPSLYNIHFHLVHFAVGVQDNAEVYFSLYDATEKKFISERFMCQFNANGTPLNPDLIGNVMAVFTDLSLEDFTRNLYLTCHIIQQGTRDKKSNSVLVRKPYGCGVENLLDLRTNIGDQDKRTYKMKIYSNLDQEFYQQHDMIIRNNERACKQTPANIGIEIKLQVLQGQFEALKFTRKVARVRKMGFADVIDPEDQRNDLYVVLDGAKLHHTQFSSRTKPVEVTVCAVDGNGKKMKCICFSDSLMFHEQYESYVNGSSSAIRWNENIKFRMPATAFSQKENMHIRFEIRTIGNRNKKLVAIAFIRLTKDDDTTVEDAEHTLFIYKCAEQTILQTSDYINLPASEREMNKRATYVGGNHNFTMANNSSLTIRTMVCSTKLTQNGNVVQLLKWRMNMSRLEQVVGNLKRVPGEDIVVVLSDILDSLFEILDLKKPQLEKPVFRALVYIINTLNDQRYKSFTSVLDNYLHGQFSSSTLHFFLLSHLTENIKRAAEDTEHVKSMLLGLQHFFKLIFMSHTNLQSTMTVDQLDIVEKIRDLIESLNTLMCSQVPKLEDLQLIVLQNAVSMYSEMMSMGIYTGDEVCQFTVDILESINKKELPPKLLLAKLNCILDTVRSPLFHDMSARRVFVRPIVPQLRQHLQKQEAVEQCVDIVSEMLALLKCMANQVSAGSNSAKGKEEIDEDIGLISREVLESLLNVMNSRLASTEELKRQEVTKTMTCLLTLLSIMEEKHYTSFCASFVDNAMRYEFLGKVFVGFNGICKRGIFQEKRWVVMNMLCNRVLLRATQFFSRDLQPTLNEDGSLELWTKFFQLAVTFITQHCLKFEMTYSSAKTEQLKKTFGDLRLEMAQLMIEKWNSLGAHQVRLASQSMIGSFLDVSLLPESSLRRATIPLLFDIIKWEWQEKRDLSELEMILIDSVDDKLCRNSQGDERYATLFREIMMEKLKDESWRQQGEELVSKVTKLFERLIDYRLSQLHRENRYLRLSATHSLIHFYKDEVVRDIYKRHIMALKDIHLEVEDYYEAACTLALHASTLVWGAAKKEHELKERLYDEILQIVDRGQVWEYGIPILKELEEQYEQHFFDYPKVSAVLKQRAEFFEKISSSHRQSPVYFKVDFYGHFPHVRSTQKGSKSFIFKGAAFDKTDTMLEKLQSDFPKAKMWTRKEPPTEEQLAEHNQYIELRAVEPVPDIHLMFNGRDDVPQEIMHYYSNYKIQRFKFDKPFHRGEKDKSNEFKTLWLERTILTTASELPSLLIWSEIVDVTTYERTPLEKSLEDIENKIQSIMNETRYYRMHQKENINPLTSLLVGTIDAAVMGGISKIRECFMSDEYLEEHPDDAEMVEVLRELIHRQLYVLDEALTLHGTLIPQNMNELQDLLETKIKKQFQEAGLTRTAEPAARVSMNTRSSRISRANPMPSPVQVRQRGSYAGMARTTSHFFVSLDQVSPDSGISSRKFRATIGNRPGKLASPDDWSESNRVSSASSTITEEQEPETVSITSTDQTRDSGIGSSTDLTPTLSPEQAPPPPAHDQPPPLPARPISTASTSSHGSSNFSSSSPSSRPPSSEESEKVLDEHRPGPTQEPAPRPTTLPYSADMNGDTTARNDHSPSPPPLPKKKTSRTTMVDSVYNETPPPIPTHSKTSAVENVYDATPPLASPPPRVAVSDDPADTPPPIPRRTSRISSSSEPPLSPKPDYQSPLSPTTASYQSPFSPTSAQVLRRPPGGPPPVGKKPENPRAKKPSET